MIKEDIIYLAAVIIAVVFHQAAKYRKITDENPALEYTALVPLVGTMFSLTGVGFEKALMPLYAGAGLYSLCYGFRGRKKTIAAGAAALVLGAVSAVLCLVSGDYRRPTYMTEFDEMFSMMRKYYVLTDYKKIDWDGIYEKYSPQVEALETGMDDEYAEICFRMSNEFNDRHISIIPSNAANEKAVWNVIDMVCGKDPGFSAVKLEDGRILACCVDEDSDAYRAGMRNGSELTAFDGKEINEYIDSTEPEFTSFSDRDNLEFFRPIAAFGTENDKAEVTFRDESGKETTAEVTASGKYAERIRQVGRTLFGDTDEYYNLSWRDLGGGTACLVMGDFMNDPALFKEMTADKLNEMHDKYDYPIIKIRMDHVMKEMKDAGISRLVIDLRNNGGGDVGQCGFIASYFTDEKLFMAAEEYKDHITGKSVVTEPLYTDVETKMWDDGEIVLLVGSETASAAEIFARAMSKLPNVTVMGMTDTSGVAMGVGSVCFERECVQFPMIRMVDENGDILIDSDTDMQGGLKIDIKLPLDEQAFDDIFIDGKDYMLERAQEYLNSK